MASTAHNRSRSNHNTKHKVSIWVSIYLIILHKIITLPPPPSFFFTLILKIFLKKISERLLLKPMVAFL